MYFTEIRGQLCPISQASMPIRSAFGARGAEYMEPARFAPTQFSGQPDKLANRPAERFGTQETDRRLQIPDFKALLLRR